MKKKSSKSKTGEAVDKKRSGAAAGLDVSGDHKKRVTLPGC
jgi:hypothetical protein